MVSKHERERLEEQMKQELEGRGTYVFYAAAGLVFLFALVALGPMLEAGTQVFEHYVASYIFDRLGGIPY